MVTRPEVETVTTQPQLMVDLTVPAIAMSPQTVTSVAMATGDANNYALTTMVPTHVVATLVTKFLQETGKNVIVRGFSFIL